MASYKEEWELKLDELEKEIAYLLEQLDGAGIDLSSLYKLIEKEVPNSCNTEAWRGRTHWFGAEIPEEATKSVAKADEYLRKNRPVKRWCGASGFLGKKIAKCDDSVAGNETTDKYWEAFHKLCSKTASMEDRKHWASVYLANTPLQAAALGLKCAGVNEVEEIGDVDGASSDYLVADAIENEKGLGLTEEQKRNIKKIKEEDDAKDDLRIHRKQMRYRKQNKEGELVVIDVESQMDLVMVHDNGSTEDVPKHQELQNATKSEVFISSSSESGSDVDAKVKGRRNLLESEVETISVSDSDSDVDGNIDSSILRRRKKIRRILDDAELGEETQKKIAIEKERQERLRSLEVTESIMFEKGVAVEVEDNPSNGYIINLLREGDEEAVRIPPSISVNLKSHQISGVRFLCGKILSSQ